MVAVVRTCGPRRPAPGTARAARRRSAVGRPAVAAVGVGERVGVAAPRRGCARAGRRRRRRGPGLPARPAAAAGRACRAAAPDRGVLVARAAPPALADHGSSSASSSSQSVVELVPEPGGCRRRRGRRPAAPRSWSRSKNGPTGAGVDRTARRRSPEALGGHAVAADETTARAHVLLLADDVGDAVAAVRGERLVGVLEQVRRGARSRAAPSSAAGRAASAGAAANRLITSSAPAAFSSRIVTRPWCARLDDALAEDVGDVELVRVARRPACWRTERLDRLVPDAARPAPRRSPSRGSAAR